MSIEPAAVAIIALAVTLGALAKGITGLGLPLVGIPVIATFLGVEQAVILMAVPTFVTNVWLIREHRHHTGEARHLPVMVGLGFVGTVIGTIFLTRVDPAPPATILGVVILAYLGLRVAKPTWEFSERATTWSSPGVGLVGGLLQGATGVSGPVITTYLHGLQLTRGALILAMTTIFQSFAVVQIGTFVVLGRYNAANIALTFGALLPILVALPIGIQLGRRIDAGRFDLLVMLLLFASSIKLLYDGIRGLIGA